MDTEKNKKKRFMASNSQENKWNLCVMYSENKQILNFIYKEMVLGNNDNNSKNILTK